MENSLITTAGCTFTGESQTMLFVSVVGAVWLLNCLSGMPLPLDQ